MKYSGISTALIIKDSYGASTKASRTILGQGWGWKPEVHPKRINEDLLPKTDFANKNSLNGDIFIHNKTPLKIS